MMESTSITCKCGMKGWIGLGEISDPFPKCGRRYEYKLIKGIAKIKRVYLRGKKKC